MSLYIGRETSKLWKRICSEVTVEINLLAENWKYILGGLICQYIHGLAARGVHYFHRPGPILQDVGFFLLPELGQNRGYISESIFTFIFLSFVAVMLLTHFLFFILNLLVEILFVYHVLKFTLKISCFFLLLCAWKMFTQPTLFLCNFCYVSVQWTFHPFFFKSKRIYTVLIWCRIFAFLVACQVLRIVTFYSTQLPGPNYHCREGSRLATLPRPDNALEVLLIIPRGVLYGCGDLIFSSHMIFSLVFVRTFQKYGTHRFIKLCAWVTVVIQSLLIIAARKHYTVDIFVAWYTVNLVVSFIDHKLPEMPDRGLSSLLLPSSKDGRPREENHKFLNGNSGDPADRRLRSQIHTKAVEDDDGSVHVEIQNSL